MSSARPSHRPRYELPNDIMRVFTPGPNRINYAGLTCSCVGHAAALGGLLFAGWNAPRRELAPKARAGPVVVNLVSYDRSEDRPPPTRPTEPSHAPASATARAPEPQAAMVNLDPRDSARTAGETATAGGAVPGAPASMPAPLPQAAIDAELSAYRRALNALIARNSRYSAAAKRQRLRGVTQLAFRLDRSGAVLDAWIQQSSGSQLLDDGAFEALDRARPLPPIPSGLPSTMELVVEIDLALIPQPGSGAGQ